MKREAIAIRDRFALANAIMLDKGLSLAARVVGWYIADHVNTRRGYAWPSQDTIAADLGIGVRTVRRAVSQLGGYFQITRRRRRANEYRPLTGQTGRSRCLDRPNRAPKRPHLASHPYNDPLNKILVPRKRATRPRRTHDKKADKKFAAFKAAYPKRDGSQGWQPARKHFGTAIKNGVSADDLIAAAGKFADSLPADTRGTKFVPMAETWLCKKNYSEYLPAPVDHEAEKQRDADMRARGYEWRDDRGWTKMVDDTRH